MVIERLQKILARAGYGSRRACEVFLREKRVTVNGKIAALGDKADPLQDDIRVDGKRITIDSDFQYYAIYKPRKVLSGLNKGDPRLTVRQLLPIEGHLFVIGRLDYESEGLMILTNDGSLTYQLTHPKFGHEKEYRVLLAKAPDEAQLDIWRRGVVLDDGKRTAPARVWVESRFGKGAWVRVVMKEGRNRQIRRIGEQIGLPIVKIIRIRIGNVRLGKMKPGEWRVLSQAEIAKLLKRDQKTVNNKRKKRRSKH